MHFGGQANQSSIDRAQDVRAKKQLLVRIEILIALLKNDDMLQG